jgi:hypothetical protein
MTQKTEEKGTTSLRMVIKYFIRKSIKYKRLVMLNVIGMSLVSIVGIISPIYLTKFVDVF